MSTVAPDASSGPRPGSLEWLAETDGDAPLAVDGQTGHAVSRAEHETRATALAHGLAAEHAVAAGDRVAVALPASPLLLEVLYALAKLGATGLLLAPGHPEPQLTARTAGCRLLVGTAAARSDNRADGGPGGPDMLPATACPGLRERHAGGPALLSGAAAPADGVQATDEAHPRLLLRTRSPQRRAALAVTFGDLLARVARPAGGVHLLGPAAHRSEVQFWTGVALVTGATVVTLSDPEPAALLRALGAHEVTSLVLGADELRALTALPPSLTDDADLTALVRIVADVGPGGRAPDCALVTACADLCGDDVLHAVYATPQTGPLAHAGADALVADPAALTALAGVTLLPNGAGRLHVRSPAAADGALGDPTARDGWPAPPAWLDVAVPTDDTATVGADGRVRLAARTGATG